MKKYNKFFLSLGLLLSGSSMHYASQEETVGHEINSEAEQINTDITHAEIDAEFYEILQKFFDEKDKTAFSKIVLNIANLLKIKKILLPDAQHAKCDEIILLLENNTHNSNYVFWYKIIPDLKSLMSNDVRTYINGIPMNLIVKRLIQKSNIDKQLF